MNGGESRSGRHLSARDVQIVTESGGMHVHSIPDNLREIAGPPKGGPVIIPIIERLLS